MQGFLHCVKPPGMDFSAIFTQKIVIIWVKMAVHVLEKIFELVLKTIYKKVLPKYQANARFPSLC